MHWCAHGALLCGRACATRVCPLSVCVPGRYGARPRPGRTQHHVRARPTHRAPRTHSRHGRFRIRTSTGDLDRQHAIELRGKEVVQIVGVEPEPRREARARGCRPPQREHATLRGGGRTGASRRRAGMKQQRAAPGRNADTYNSDLQHHTQAQCSPGCVRCTCTQEGAHRRSTDLVRCGCTR